MKNTQKYISKLTRKNKSVQRKTHHNLVGFLQEHNGGYIKK